MYKRQVNTPPGPHHDVAIDTDEGTWMTVDISPDGQTIVFDLLGDIYTMPATGGDAKAISSGVSWDMQPRFSPDGQWIAFTSDRAGGDNIWIMKRDGTEPKQVSKESFRLVNSPAWSPDGEWIAGHKHFTAERCSSLRLSVCLRRLLFGGRGSRDTGDGSHGRNGRRSDHAGDDVHGGQGTVPCGGHRGAVHERHPREPSGKTASAVHQDNAKERRPRPTGPSS